MSPAWDFSELLRSFYPGSNRTALPEVLLQASTTVALMQGWPRMAACKRLGLFALLRPCEFLEAKRSQALGASICILFGVFETLETSFL